MEMTRRPGWRGALQRYFVQANDQRFRWGRMDCALFCCGGIEAMTGWNPASAFGLYASEAEGLEVLRAAGFDSHEAAFAAICAPVDLALINVGDLVAIETDRGVAMGICAGADVRAMMPSGLAVLSMSAAARGYRV